CSMYCLAHQLMQTVILMKSMWGHYNFNSWDNSNNLNTNNNLNQLIMKTMKNTMHVMLVALALIFTTTSCNNDDDGGDGGNAAAGTLQAKVDGSNFTSASQTTNATLINAGGTSTLSIFGSDLNGKTITLGINGVYDGVGTYEIGGGANVMVNASYT